MSFEWARIIITFLALVFFMSHLSLPGGRPSVELYSHSAFHAGDGIAEGSITTGERYGAELLIDQH